MKGFIVRIITVSIFIISFIHIPVFADDGGEQLREIDRMADEALHLAKMKRYDETKMIVKTLGERIDSPYGSLPLTMDERRVLRVAYLQAEQILESDSINETDLIQILTKFRLTTDALATEHDPLWFDMESVLIESIHSAKQAVGDERQFQETFREFLLLYDTVYLGMILDVPFEKVQALDAQIQYIEQHADPLNDSGALVDEMERLESYVQSVFSNHDEDEADPSLWWVIISTGGIIILTLTYAGWKKYKGEKMKQKQLKKQQKY
ncbi:sporulation protein YpjB [Fervidibacillus albus]|uniref:Sporulation protein YpjB n=1 Tax=Fervidibacillus albus TaxID=2980026 RepID=A0A9E8LWV4_9BACI|nr:sporulation protein YpjB [Fervidibacillus albus]WAA10571.1 sporulation protein YpjB [Fervidibacillus albus]